MKKFLIVLLLLTFGLVFVPAFADDGGALSQSQMLDKARHQLQTVLDLLNKNLSSAADSLTVLPPNTPDSDAVLTKLSNSLPGIVDVAFIDPNGIISAIKPDTYMRFEGKNLSKQAQFSKLKSTLKPVTSPIFTATEGYYSVAFQYPIITPQGNWIGAVSCLTDAISFLGDVLEPLNQDQPQRYYFTVIQKDGCIVYDSDPAQINLNVFTNPLYKKQPGLRDAAKLYCKTLDGTTTFKATLHKTQYTVKSMWSTVTVYGMDWRVVVSDVIGMKTPPPSLLK